MSRPSKWWWGLLPLAVLWLLAIFFKTSVVEEDVQARTGAAVAASELEVQVAGRDVTLAGATLTTEMRDAAEVTRGVRLVRGGVHQIATSDAYDWSVRRDGGAVVLSGQVPSAPARERIAAAARAAFPGAEIRDETVVAAGAPSGFEEAAIHALGQAARLSDGRVSLSGGRYSLAGTAPTPAAYEAVLAATRDLPEGLTLASVDVRPPGDLAESGEHATEEVGEGIERAERTERAARSQGAATVEGAATGEGAATAEGAARAESAESTESTERAESAESARAAERAEKAERAEGAESAEGAERAESVERAERIGSAEDAERMTETTAPAEVASAATDAAGGTEPAEPDTCKQLFAEVLERATFRFETGSTALSAESARALDELVTVAGRCPEVRLEIAGHADSVGAEAFNLELSRRRAQAAVDHLTRTGIPAARLTVTAHGESRPVASNDTEGGRSGNRRIEIHVQ